MVFTRNHIRAKELRVSICTSFLGVNHQVNVISKLKTSKNLPFSEVLTKADLSHHLQNNKQRDRIFSAEVTLWAFLSQVIEDDKSQQAAVGRIVAAAIAHGKRPPSANTSAYSQARSRLSEESLAALVREIAQRIESNTPNEWRWKNKRIKLIDGSTLSMPDTQQNQDVYPQSKSQKAGVGFPLARIVAIIDYITGVVLDFAMGPCCGKQTGEHALLRELLPLFDTDDIVIGDRYYPSFFLMAALIKRDVSGVFPAHHCRKPDFRKGKRLSKKDHIVGWKKPNKPAWMEQAEYDAVPNEIVVREFSTELKRPGFRTKTQAGLLDENTPEIYEKLLEAINYKQIGNRPGRQEPRRVKRRPKPFPLLQKARCLYANAA